MSALLLRLQSLTPAKRALLESTLLDQLRDRPIEREASPEIDARVLSYSEQRLWFLEQLHPGQPIYTLAGGVRVHGDFDAARLQFGVAELVRRHESLRTCFRTSGGQPTRVVLPELSLAIEEVDLREVDTDQREFQLKREATAAARRPFDLEQGPLMRCLLYRLDEQDQVVLLTMHHIISDGWSMGLLLRELADSYARSGTSRIRPGAMRRYAEFANWQRSEAAQKKQAIDLEYWREQLHRAPHAMPLPTDRPTGDALSPEGKTARFRVKDSLTESLRALAKEQRTTPFVVLLAAFQVLLGRVCRQHDVVVGTAVSGRYRQEFHDLIGFFVNTLVLRQQLTDESFRDLVRRDHELVLNALAHQDLPFDQLVEELASRDQRNDSPLFNVSIVYQDAPPIPGSAGLKVESFPVDPETSKYDLTLYFFDAGDHIESWIEYRTSLFDASTIHRIWGCFTTLLTAALAQPSDPITNLPLLGDAERQLVLEDFNGAGDTGSTGCLHELFELQAGRHAQRVALVSTDASYTYAEVEEQANRMARWLKNHGLTEEGVVGVQLPRSPELTITMLAVLKAGGIFLPLDPDEPAHRLDLILGDAKPTLVITADSHFPAQLVPMCSFVSLENIESQAASLTSKPVPWKCLPEQAAYIIFTSGSTGRPKGVVVEHRNIVNFVHAQNGILGLDESDRVLQFFAPVFDGSIAETFNALAVGGCLVIGDSSIYSAPDTLAGFIRQQGVTACQFTPTTLRSLDPGLRDQIRTIVSAGEELGRDLVSQWGTECRLFNAYGPTEASVGTSMIRCTRPGSCAPPIGFPLPGVQVYVVDEHLKPVPIGVPGEIVIGGRGVARGYLNRLSETEDSFIPDIFQDAGGRLYRSGDLGRWRSGGVLEFLGRIDDRVKIRGYRVEPGEIAAVIRQQPEVENAIVVVDELREHSQLVAYVVTREHEQGGSREEAEREHWHSWRALMNETFRRTPPPSDPTFHPAGWISSRSGRPFPPEELRNWIRATAERLAEGNPRRILDIGCNTGMLLFELAPNAESYVATSDIEDSLHWLQKQIDNLPELCDKVTLCNRAAEDLEGLEGPFDLVLLNSNVPYFSSCAYLLKLLHRLAPQVAPQGRIVLNSLLNLTLHQELASSIEFAHATDNMTCGELRERVETRCKNEQELLVDPDLFTTLTTLLPRLGHREVLLTRGDAGNELTQYRYDVVLHFDCESVPVAGKSVEWAQGYDSLSAIEQQLQRAECESFVVRGVPNLRLQHDLQLAHQLQALPDSVGLAQLRQRLTAQERSASVDPESVWQLAEQNGFQARLSVAESRDTFDAEFRRIGQARLAPVSSLPQSAIMADLSPGHPWSRFTNNPVAASLQRRAMGALWRSLQERLPGYMLPTSIVPLDKFPLTTSGKVDRQALPQPPSVRPDWSGGYVAPRDEHEQVVAEAWETVLGISPIGVTDNFFDLGGHSMLAVRMIAEIEEQTGRRLPLLALFQQPTVEHLARMLREPDNCPPESSLVPLERRGNQNPLFLVHPAGGTVFCYQPLVRYLGGDRPVYGLQAAGLDGVWPPHETVDEMVAHYLRAIHSVQPEGPYYIGGWSLGGNLAFELARQLLESGEEVEILALIDSGAIAPGQDVNEDDFLPVVMGMFPDEGDLSLDELKQMSPDEHLDYFLARAVKSGIAVSDSDRETARRLFDVFKLNLKAMWEYRPQPYAGRIALFASEEQPDNIEVAQEPCMGWSRWTDQGVEIEQIPGRHFDMIREPNVQILATRLQQALLRADKRIAKGR